MSRRVVANNRSNPFSDPALAHRYEAWYSTTGLRADRLEKRLLQWLLARFPGARTLLEVGCGTGHFTRWFEARGLRATGVDISAAMIAEAVRLGTEVCVRGDALRLPFARGAFDLVALITSVEFLPDPVEALAEARRVARQGLILGVINRSSLVGRRYRRQGGLLWESARFLTAREVATLVRRAVGSSAYISWKTTLWPFWPGALPLPWGGFIGMGVAGLQEEVGEHE